MNPPRPFDDPRGRLIAAAVAGAVLLAWWGWTRPPAVGTAGPTPCKFVRAIDGDTILVELDGMPKVFSPIEVRIAGIDTPELRDSRPEIRKIATEAKAFTDSACRSAKSITLLDVRRDKYFRLLAGVEADGRNVGDELVTKDLARRYQGKGPKPW